MENLESHGNFNFSKSSPVDPGKSVLVIRKGMRGVFSLHRFL
jgi:hypothetical protein